MLCLLRDFECATTNCYFSHTGITGKARFMMHMPGTTPDWKDSDNEVNKDYMDNEYDEDFELDIS